MSSEIQFGDLEHSEPQSALRPDQDGHFVVAPVGNVSDDELPIFVDLDVLRDMEAHARSNTRVELGGVMLGRQCVDDAGHPFVFVTDALRAHHYEATQGSFKFTHDTWSQITRERKAFRPDLEMVGWYHTHPGWSVFLSGMDLFICNHFFDRQLDVALVIDPCADDRGWFQWTDENPRVTRQTGGFFVTTGRYRQRELEHFVRIYNKEPVMTHDPRYAGNWAGTDTGGNQPMVSLMDSRKPFFEIAILSMLLMQFVLLTALAWRMLTPLDATEGAVENSQVVMLQQKLLDLESAQLQRTRDAAYREVLQSIVGAQTGENDLVENFADLKTSHQQVHANLIAQMALAEKLNREKDLANRELETKSVAVDDLSRQLVATRDMLSTAKLEIAELSKIKSSANALEVSENEGSAAGIVSLSWWWLGLGGSLLTFVAGLAGFGLSRLGLAAKSRPRHDELDEREGHGRIMDRASVSFSKPKTEAVVSSETMRAD
jgi:proteasome lid subunit RPN8/RPN11